MSDLALLGGPKAISTPPPHFVWPRVDDEMRQAVLQQMDKSLSIYDRSGIFGEVEDRFKAGYSVKHALLTNSGTSALHSAYFALGLRPGDEVICPSYTFHATVTPMLQLGIKPVFVDVGPDGNLDPVKLAAAMTSHTKAIAVTHMWGVPARMDDIMTFARQRGLKVLEDGSHAHGAKLHGRPVGNFGDVAAFSLQGGKTITGGEGGVLLTNNDEVYWQALAFGHYNKRPKQEIPAGHPLSDIAVTGYGLKLRAHPLAVAIIGQQMDHHEEVLAGRRELAEQVTRRIRRIPGLSPPIIPAGGDPSWYAYCMQYDPSVTGVPIGRFFDAVIAEGATELDRPGSTGALNLLPLFQESARYYPNIDVRYGPGDFPVAEQLQHATLKLPMWDLPEHQDLAMGYCDALEKVSLNARDLLLPGEGLRAERPFAT